MATTRARAADLFINQNGRIVCLSHGGGYLTSAIERRPSAMTVDTPLDNWERLLGDEVQEYGVSCEDC